MTILACVEIKFYGAFVLNHRVVLYAIDATPARWRGDAGSSPLDRARTTASSPRNDLVKNCRVHPTHWLISTQVATRGLLSRTPSQIIIRSAAVTATSSACQCGICICSMASGFYAIHATLSTELDFHTGACVSPTTRRACRTRTCWTRRLPPRSRCAAVHKSNSESGATGLAESSGERPHCHAVELESRRWRGGHIIQQWRRHAATI